MSEPRRIALIGASGLVGRTVLAQAARCGGVRLVALARREVRIPHRQNTELVVAPPARWSEALADMRPDGVVCALGTTWKKAGRNEAAFRAVDHDLVLRCAEAAKAHGAASFVLVSSVGANPVAGNFYLRVKGETERDLAALRFARLDILRPGLLLGTRENDRRVAERLGIVAAPLVNRLLLGPLRQYRGITAQTVARAALALATSPESGQFVHTNEELLRAARHLPAPNGDW